MPLAFVLRGDDLSGDSASDDEDEEPMPTATPRTSTFQSGPPRPRNQEATEITHQATVAAINGILQEAETQQPMSEILSLLKSVRQDMVELKNQVTTINQRQLMIENEQKRNRNLMKCIWGKVHGDNDSIVSNHDDEPIPSDSEPSELNGSRGHDDVPMSRPRPTSTPAQRRNGPTPARVTTAPAGVRPTPNVEEINASTRRVEDPYTLRYINAPDSGKLLLGVT